MERANRDLKECDIKIRFSAYEWFTEWRNVWPRYISYKDICDCIELSEWEKDEIERRVEVCRLTLVEYGLLAA